MMVAPRVGVWVGGGGVGVTTGVSVGVRVGPTGGWGGGGRVERRHALARLVVSIPFFSFPHRLLTQREEEVGGGEEAS